MLSFCRDGKNLTVLNRKSYRARFEQLPCHEGCLFHRRPSSQKRGLEVEHSPLRHVKHRQKTPTMKRLFFLCAAGFSAAKICAEPALTIYNQNFAVVRDTIHLDLRQGENTIRYDGATMHLEPDSVVLRDPAGARHLQILEQNFRADPVSQGLLLNYFEGKTIEFERDATLDGQAKREIIRGKIIRSGYVSHHVPYQEYGGQYAETQAAYALPESGGQPIIEVEGKLMFRLPGEPLFPALPNDSILKPTLTWQIQADQAGPLEAELGYVTGGMSWHADYNLVAPESSDTLDLVGWVTMDNESGKSFNGAKIKLMAGDVSKVQPNAPAGLAMYRRASARAMAPPVTEKAFDEYHLYALERPATLLDREMKQVEFVSANGISSKVIYTYDGAAIDPGFSGLRENREYGIESTPKVQVTREFFNSATNHLGMPLPAGRMRFYRRDADGQLEFTGENNIGHTPRGERVRMTTGVAFDLVGERTRMDFRAGDGWIEESFQIKVRNHKKSRADVRIVEHLYRWSNWNIAAHSDGFVKEDAQTIEIPVTVEPDAEKTVTYTVHYSW